MLNDVRKNTARFIRGARQKGWSVRMDAHSVNRLGGNSIYFTIFKNEPNKKRYATVRISDHIASHGTHMIGFSGGFLPEKIDELVAKL